MAERSAANYFTPLVGSRRGAFFSFFFFAFFFFAGQKRSQDAALKIALGLIVQLCFTRQ